MGTFGQFVSLVPLGIAVCGVALTVIAGETIAAREQVQIRDRTEAEARHVSAQLRVGMSQSFEPLRRIASWWLLQGRPVAPEDWETDAQLFVSSKAGLSRIVWLDRQGVPEWSAQPGGLPEFRREAPDSRLRAAVAVVRKSNGNAFSPVFQSDGRLLVYECAPISRDSQFVGYIAALYDYEAFVRSLLESQAPEQYAVRVMADGRAVALAGSRDGDSGLAKEARVRVANASWTVSVTPAFDASSGLRRAVTGFGVLGSVLLWVCAAMSRISRRRAKELEAANHEFQTLLEVLPVGIAIADDAECRRIWTNRTLAGMLQVPLGANISPTASAGAECRMQRNGVDVPPEELPMQTAARTGASVANDYLDIVRADGSVLHTLAYAAPLFDEAGRVRGVIDVCVDITDRKALEDRLQHAEKFQSLALMAGGIAHDFNNLLTVIIGNASSVVAEMSEWSPARRSMGDLQAAAARAADLVGQLLAFTGRFWCEVAPVSLTREIEELKPAIRGSVPPAVAIAYDLADDLPLIEADPAELQKVIDSLVSNAVESFDEELGGRIEIRTSQCELSPHHLEIFYPDQRLRPGRYVRLEMSDDGCGIPDEILGRIFDPFFTTKFVGRGLGLSAVQGIVRAHSGGIRVTSALHHGTQVELIFPAWTPTPERAFPPKDRVGI
jgi:signal transduction histidine kinase